MPGHTEFQYFLIFNSIRLFAAFTITCATQSLGMDTLPVLLIAMTACFLPPLLISLIRIPFPAPPMKHTLYDTLEELHLRLCGYALLLSLICIAATSFDSLIANRENHRPRAKQNNP